jgi:hypothetical protein
MVSRTISANCALGWRARRADCVDPRHASGPASTRPTCPGRAEAFHIGSSAWALLVTVPGARPGAECALGISWSGGDLRSITVTHAVK